MDKRSTVDRAVTDLLAALRRAAVGDLVGTYDQLSRSLRIPRSWVKEVLVHVEQQGYIERRDRHQAVVKALPPTPRRSEDLPATAAYHRLKLARDLVHALPDTPVLALSSQVALLATTIETALELVEKVAKDAERNLLEYGPWVHKVAGSPSDTAEEKRSFDDWEPIL